MTESATLTQVGAPDPELRNSPLIADGYFIGVEYRHGDRVCSSSELLRCEMGVWLVDGGCDSEHV